MPDLPLLRFCLSKVLIGTTMKRALLTAQFALSISIVGLIMMNILVPTSKICEQDMPLIPRVQCTTAVQDFNVPVSHHANESAVLCALAVHEEAYVDEWVDYYYGLGFSGIFLYDNSPDNNLRQWAKEKYPYGFVTVKHFPGEHMQQKVYSDCAKTFAVGFTWVAFFDIDEFLVLKKHRHVVDFLHEYSSAESVGAITVNWHVYVSVDQLVYKPLPVTKRFVYRDEPVNLHIKSIARVKDIVDVEHPHCVTLTDGKTQVDTNGKAFHGWFNENGPTDVAVLHHYWTKSRKEFIAKLMRGCSLNCEISRTQAHAEQILSTVTNTSTFFDDSAWRILKEVPPKYNFFDLAKGW